MSILKKMGKRLHLWRYCTSLWRHMSYNQRPLKLLLVQQLFAVTLKNAQKLCIVGPLRGEFTGGFPSQSTNKMEGISTSQCHHGAHQAASHVHVAVDRYPVTLRRCHTGYDKTFLKPMLFVLLCINGAEIDTRRRDANSYRFVSIINSCMAWRQASATIRPT